MTRPRLLDLFCGAGGAAMGYHRAGFDVVGVDINPQPNYPFEFHQADATAWDWSQSSFEAFHASPPCQAFTTMSNRHRGKGGKADDHPELIGQMRERLEATRRPWVIENVIGARREMRDAVVLHGGMFGLGVHRPRLFESNVMLMLTAGPAVDDPLGVYGTHHDGRLLFKRADGSELHAARSLSAARVAMGVDWMEWRELAESIPPAFTQFIGEQLIAALGVEPVGRLDAFGRLHQTADAFMDPEAFVLPTERTS